MSITRMSVSINVDGLGIIGGDAKRFLEQYIDMRSFEQRKSYDEYYVNASNDKYMLNIDDLSEMSSYFSVSVDHSGVVLESK